MHVQTPQPDTHTPHSHLTHTTRTTTTHRSEDRILREITGTILDSIDDRHVAWHHAREAAEIIKGAQPLVRNPHWAMLEHGRWALQPAAQPPSYELVCTLLISLIWNMVEYYYLNTNLILLCADKQTPSLGLLCFPEVIYSLLSGSVQCRFFSIWNKIWCPLPIENYAAPQWLVSMGMCCLLEEIPHQRSWRSSHNSKKRDPVRSRISLVWPSSSCCGSSMAQFWLSNCIFSNLKLDELIKLQRMVALPPVNMLCFLLPDGCTW